MGQGDRRNAHHIVAPPSGVSVPFASAVSPDGKFVTLKRSVSAFFIAGKNFFSFVSGGARFFRAVGRDEVLRGVLCDAGRDCWKNLLDVRKTGVEDFRKNCKLACDHNLRGLHLYCRYMDNLSQKGNGDSVEAGKIVRKKLLDYETEIFGAFVAPVVNKLFAPAPAFCRLPHSAQSGVRAEP